MANKTKTNVTLYFQHLGLAAGVGKGLLRALNCDAKLVGDMLPVDIPINLMIAAAWNRVVNQT